MAKSRKVVTFAGVTFSGILWGTSGHYEHYVTVPTNVFKKMLAKGQLLMHMDYWIEHDGPGYEQGEKTADGKAKYEPVSEEWAKQTVKMLTSRPWLLYLDAKFGILHYAPHSNSSYTFKQVEAPEAAAA